MSDWKEVTAEDNPVWDKKEPIEGVLVEVKTGIGLNESNMYVLKVGEEKIGVWGSTVLNTKLGQLQIGYEVRIEPLGEVVSEKTKRKYQDYKVLFKNVPFVEVQEHPKDEPTPEPQGEEEINLDDIPF